MVPPDADISPPSGGESKSKILRRLEKTARSAVICAATPENPDNEEEREGSVETEERPKIQKARRFRVIFHNDDYTTMEFVVRVLMKFFHKTETEAHQIMLTVHHKGQGVAGIYPRDVAETKVTQVMEHAKEQGMPLLVTAEPE
jgi:ATP-dependent Clp protease adaptor protein ClpS